jgi:histone acetyltransferase (RNA polymerase elongator complex component)
VAGSNITNLAQLVHNEMKKEMVEWWVVRDEFYKRLYGDYKLISSVNDFVKLIAIVSSQALCNDIKELEIQTFVIWVDPDLVSYRNFVCLDTRSREIRNKNDITLLQSLSNDGVVNLIIRRYRSSVGMEYFISFEDRLGYLYGFTRLLISSNSAMIRELHVYWNVETLNRW